VSRTVYGALLVVLQAAGLVSSVWFLVTHKPTRWRRLQAVDAMGFPAIIALVFARGLILTISAWPVALRPWPHMVFSIVTLVLVDAWMAVKLINFRRFVKRDHDANPFSE